MSQQAARPQDPGILRNHPETLPHEAEPLWTTECFQPGQTVVALFSKQKSDGSFQTPGRESSTTFVVESITDQGGGAQRLQLLPTYPGGEYGEARLMHRINGRPEPGFATRTGLHRRFLASPERAERILQNP